MRVPIPTGFRRYLQSLIDEVKISSFGKKGREHTCNEAEKLSFFK